MLSGILIKCMDFFSLLFWSILICVSNVIYPKMAYHIKFYKIETLKVKKKIFHLKFEGTSDCMQLINLKLTLTNPCTLKRSLYIYSTIPVYYCFVHVLERKNYLLNYLEDFETDGSYCFLKRTKYLLLFYPQSILFLILIVTNIL